MENFKNPLIDAGISNMNMDVLHSKYIKLGKDWVANVNVKASYTRVYFVIDGEGKISVNGETVILKPNNIYVVPSNTDFYYSCDEYLEKLYFHIRLCGVEKTDILSSLDKCIVLKNKGALIRETVNNYIGNGLNNCIAIKSALHFIVSEVISGKNLGDIKEYSAPIKKAMIYIDNNLSATLLTADIADSLFISSSKLNKLFKKEVGITIGKYVMTKVLSKAEDMLKSTDKSVKQISEELNFCDQFYFSRIFSKYYGSSPIQYRKNLF